MLDAGCGTGEITARLAERFPGASFVGIDLEEPHLEKARARSAAFGSRVRFERGDVLSLDYSDDTFDLAISRHVVQALPDAPRPCAKWCVPSNRGAAYT